MIKIMFFIVVSTNYILANNDCTNRDTICSQQNNCRDCIRAHHCCIWTYEKNFESSRCFSKDKQEQFDSKFIENNAMTKVKVTQNSPFTDIGDDINDAIQLSPQEYTIDLRYDEPVNITIQYRPAKNYHLDLYYLMDLTMSMQPDLNTLKNLGSQLTNLLVDLTTNHRIAFGSYMDKPEMPFYRTDPLNKENPCRSESEVCEPGYLFKHKLNFTNDVGMFIKEVDKSRVSANSDDLEGGMDAVMQIILCRTKLEWKKNSRKIILVATEGSMHLAGDGLLAGYVKRNEECWINDDGNYTSATKYDYPSLEEVYKQLKNKKINMIIAAKSNVQNYYEEMAKLLKETVFVGELKNKSTNVLNLVKEGYYAFLRKVNLFKNFTTSGLSVEFFADCDGDQNWEKKSSCTNAEEGKVMDFKVQIKLKEYQNQPSDILYIQENNINDRVAIKLNFVGSSCKCSFISDDQKKSCQHGEFNCGDCLCYEGWTGDKCSEECISDFSKCRFTDDNGDLSLTCAGRGECICGKCTCNTPRYQGKFCEYECPYNRETNQVCGGHGDCINGTCHCNEQYTGDDCSCQNATVNCIIPGSESVCSGNGICTCNKCECLPGYSNTYCEFCDFCTGLCGEYEKNVIEHVINKNPQNETVQVEIVENLEEEERTCLYRYFNEESICDLHYKYSIANNKSVAVKAMEPKCKDKPMAAGLLAGLIIAAFVALLALVIIIWKGRNYYKDKKEYAEFLENRKNATYSESNPFYKSPVTTYQNPMEMSSLHSKSE